MFQNIKKVGFFNIGLAIKNFPVSFLASISLFYVVLQIIWKGNSFEEFSLRYIVSFSFLFLLGIIVELWYKESGYSKKVRILVNFLAIIISVICFLIFPFKYDFDLYGLLIVKYFLLILGFLLVILTFPFLHKQKMDNLKVYKYVFSVFSCVILGLLLSIVIFLLGSLLIALLDNLFDLISSRYEEEWFFSLWVFCATIVGPFFFLTNIYKFILERKEESEIPKWIFALFKYIIIPFVLIYFVVLYLYTGKVILTWEWPESTVSWFIISFSLLGFVSYLVVFLWKEQSILFKFFVKIFPWSVLFQVPVLFIALWFRISEYGITLDRYLVGILGIWLVFFSLYFILVKNAKIVFISSSLLILVFISAVGPLSALNVSKISQLNRFVFLVEKYNSDKNFSSEENKENIRSIIYYLTETHGIEFWKKEFPLINEKVFDDKTKANNFNSFVTGCSNNCSSGDFSRKLEELLGIEYSDNYHSDNSFSYSFPYEHDNEEVFNIKDYNFFFKNLRFGESEKENKDVLFKDGEIQYKLVSNYKEKSIVFYKENEIIDTLYFNEIAQKILDAKLNHTDLEKKDFNLKFEKNKLDILINVGFISGEKENDKVKKLDSLNIISMFIKLK